MLTTKGLFVAASLALAFLLFLSGLAHPHEIYSSWKKPGTNISCCDDRDCYPTQARFENGQWSALRREDQRWLVIPAEAVLQDGATPDGQAHLCAPRPLTEEDTRVFCFRPPFLGG